MIPTPEHDKLAKVKAASQKCGEFLEWLKERYTLADSHTHNRGCTGAKYASHGALHCGLQQHELIPAQAVTTKLLAEFFEIDEAALENEKRAMLDEIRTAQEKR